MTNMIDYGRQRSTEKPKSMVIDEQSVWVNTNIQPVEETIGENTFIGWEFDMKQYNKDEYILLLDTQLTDTQIALVEVYELITTV
jgi:hypothetical protein